MLFFMLFEGYLVKMWYIACIPDSGRPDRPTLLEAGRGRRTHFQLRTACPWLSEERQQ